MILHPARAAGPRAGGDVGTGLVGTPVELLLGLVTAARELLGDSGVCSVPGLDSTPECSDSSLMPPACFQHLC